MNLKDIRDLCRHHLQDIEEPVNVDTPLLNDWINEAEEEAVLRAKLLYTNSSNGITVVTDQPQYDLDATALTNTYFYFDRFVIDTNEIVLCPIRLAELDKEHEGWENDDSGTPIYYVLDLLPEKLTLYPKPSSTYSGDTIDFRGYHLPSSAMATDTATPEIAARHHRHLVDWVLYRAYSLPNPDLFSPQASELALQRFERNFGLRPDAQLQQLMQRGETMPINPQMNFQLYGT